MDNNQFDAVLTAHLEALDPECRWCFAIDMERVKGEIIGRHNAPDAMLLHLSCPRCGGEWSEYIRIVGEEYLRDRIKRLPPELEGKNIYQECREALDRLWPEYPDGPPKLYRGVLAHKD